jgi:outer membrane protein assembly factor BamB
MTTSISKLKTATFALLLIFTVSSTLAILPITNAHDPVWTIPTYAYVTVSPDPVGVGQQMFVIMWIDKVAPSAAVDNDIRFHDYKLTITKPDGSTEIKTFDTIHDTTSSQFTLYTPDQIGVYTFKFEYPGETYTWTTPISASAYTGDVYLPSSATTTLTVQQNAVASPPTYPLPTSYWTRPIEGQNTAWASIASNYLKPSGAEWGAFATRLQPDGLAPSSAHVMWAEPIQDGGIVGGTNTGIDGVAYYTGLSYEGRFTTPIIIQGRIYYPLPLSDAVLGTFSGVSIGGGYVCVDLQTGEQIWKKDYAVNPSFGQIYDYESGNQHGAIPYLWAVSGTTWMAYEPSTGTWLFNLTNVPSGTNVYGPNGEILRYVLNTAGNWLALWNNTAAQGLAGAASGADMYYWRPVGKSVDASAAYSWNITIPSLPAGSTVYAAINDDLLFGGNHGSLGFWGTPDTYSYWTISLKPQSRGQIIWTKTYSAPANNATRLLYGFDPTTRTFFEADKEARQWLVYSLDTGNLLWGPVGDARDFNYYGTIGMGAAGQAGFAAYGNLYTAGYGGELFCYDLLTGDLVWKYNNTNSGVETPWGLYPLFIGAIADGKVYCFSGEHSPNSPLYKGELVRCIDAYTGEELWTISSWAGVGSFGGEGFPVADGYLVYLNHYDAQVYCIGKGPSATSVTVQNDVIAEGSSILVKGTIVDICAGAKQLVESGEFNVVPAVSDASMGAWMAYIYMQKPMPTDATGVTVHLTAVDPNGNFQDIGYVTSDVSGGFKMLWTPPVPGEYTITASFEGSESYWPSSAVTYIGVTEAPVASPTTAPTSAPTTAPTASPSVVPEPEAAPSTDIYVIAVAAAVIIVVVAVAAVFLRKRK